MKAIQLNTFGSIHNLQPIELDMPEPGADEVLIKVHFAAVNPYDYKVIEIFGEKESISLPVIPGSECSGQIEKTGLNVYAFQPGEAVCGNKGSYGGCFAEYVIMKPGEISKIPTGIPLESAAAVPVGALTAYKALIETGQLTSGQKVLIHGAAGGLGSLAVQIAKIQGAYVYATTSTESISLVKSLGADMIIDYRNQNFVNFVQDADLVLDTVGGKTQDASFSVLKKGGRLVSLVQPPNNDLAIQFQVHASMIFGEPDADRLAEILDWVKTGQLKVLVEKILPFDDAIDALQMIKQGHRMGKILLSV